MNTEKPTEIEDALDYLQFECSLSNPFFQLSLSVA